MDAEMLVCCLAQDPEDSLRRFTETLKSREFVGVNIGYGVRGHKGMCANVVDIKSSAMLTNGVFASVVGRTHGALRTAAESKLGHKSGYQDNVQ